MEPVMEKKHPAFEPSEFPVLAALNPDEIRVFRMAVQALDVAADVAVMMEGQQAQYLYMVHSGLLEVNKRHDNNIFDVASIMPGEIFGEASILYHTPACAEVRSLEPCTLFQLPCKQVREVLDASEQFQRNLVKLAEKRLAATSIAVNPVFSKLPQPVRETLLRNSRFVSLDAGETLYKEGDTDIRFMFLVLNGKAEASIKHPQDQSKHIVFARISVGDEIGEISIVTGKNHAATVTAITPLRLMMINNKAVHDWCKDYPDFKYGLYACIQRKLQHALEAIRPMMGENEAKARTIDTLPPLKESFIYDS